MANAHRILVVDDNHDAALNLKTALKELGYIVAVALDGPSALEIAKAFHPDIALLEIGLFAIDDYALARRLRDLYHAPHGPLHLVALVRFGQESDLRRAADAGFERHLSKPVDLARLAGLMNELNSGMS